MNVRRFGISSVSLMVMSAWLLSACPAKESAEQKPAPTPATQPAATPPPAPAGTATKAATPPAGEGEKPAGEKPAEHQ